ncbi:MAG: choice-of-anchor Q domain-containing protein [Chloroflexota bacterium]
MKRKSTIITLDGFTITAGRAAGSIGRGTSGGGMVNDDGSPTVANITFRANSAIGNGGGIFNDNNGSPILSNVTFTANSAHNGGGMYNNSGSSLTLTDIAFSANSASSGGGMYNASSSGNLALSSVTFAANSASSGGGGMYNNNSRSSVILTNVTFSTNSATGIGGGMRDSSNSPVLSNVAFNANSASSGGGIHYSGNGSPVLNNVTFNANSATSGGGMLNASNSPVLSNVVFSANSASSGGGIYNHTSNPVLNNVTFSANAASFEGGGMYNFSTNPMLTNVILWGNQDSSGHSAFAQMYNESSIPTIHSSLIQGSGGSDNWDTRLGIDGGNNLDADPLFVQNGDPSTDPPTLGDLHLQNGSPAIDAGNSLSVSLSTDLDGNRRIQGSAVDLGAFEATPDYGFFVQVEASHETATVGETIVYTYRVINYESAAMTVVAVDDRLGDVALTPNPLMGQATATATLTHTVVEADRPRPLVNTLTVTGRDATDAPINEQVSVTVMLTSPLYLPLIAR